MGISNLLAPAGNKHHSQYSLNRVIGKIECFNMGRENQTRNEPSEKKQPTNQNTFPNGLSPSSAVARPSVAHALVKRKHLRETMEIIVFPCFFTDDIDGFP